MTAKIITAATVITMDPDMQQAQAVAFSEGRIVAVGSLAECRGSLPGAAEVDLGDAVLMPGFVESHSHPLLTGMSLMPPAYYIAPWVAPTWDDVVAIFRKALAAAPANASLAFFGFDKLLHGLEAPTRETLDPIFGDRMAAVIDNSGHGAYVTTAVLAELGWLENPPPDPPGAFYGRNDDGSLNGQAMEVSAVLAVTAPVLTHLGGSPLHQAADFMAALARVGVTATSEMTYADTYKQGYQALQSLPGAPVRVSAYHMSTDPTCGEEVDFGLNPDMLRKQGIKLWADGSVWVGNVAISFPYLDTPTTRLAGISSHAGGLKEMNYTREQLDALLDAHAAQGWQMSFHVNGDLGIDVVLDAYERALSTHGLLGTDHRWRIEHAGAARPDHMQRAGALGVVVSMSPFQFYYWGDLLDGKIFSSEIGANWQPFRSAFDADVHPAFHNDGSVSPPNPLLNVQTAVTRRTSSGTVRGPEHAISLDEGLAAETINAAYVLKRDHEIGSIEVGKFADFVELSMDPHVADPASLAAEVQVLGTWLAGTRVDLDSYLASAGRVPGQPHEHLQNESHDC